MVWPQLEQKAIWIYLPGILLFGLRDEYSPHKAIAGAVDLAGYGVALPSQFEIRTIPAELLKVRHRLLGWCARVPHRQDGEGDFLHGGIHPRHWHL
jgi:hypothetical protein